ncbi:hypothetical protein WJT86_10125 [Microvirga sp. W0021]|uniref:Uncharacterized protein n=1 Tax=Hohaiivirga grylli TaxID=3133970 RepID=A0ABV0BL39_9HYPH
MGKYSTEVDTFKMTSGLFDSFMKGANFSRGIKQQNLDNDFRERDLQARIARKMNNDSQIQPTNVQRIYVNPNSEYLNNWRRF